MKTLSLQHILLPLLLLLSGSSYWFLQARSATLQNYKAQQSVSYPTLQKDTNNRSLVQSNPSKQTPNQEDQKEFQEEDDLLPDVQLLKFILDKSKEGLPVLQLPQVLYR